MNLVRKLVYVTLVMPFVYCSTPQRDTASAVIPNDLNTVAKPTQQQQLNNIAGSRRQRENDDDIEAKKMTFIEARQKPLKAMLSKQLEALQSLQQEFQKIVDEQKQTNQMEAFKTACFASNIEVLLSDTQSALTCLELKDINAVVIGIGAVPAILQSVDTFTGCMDGLRKDCDLLKQIARRIHGITDDIPNVDLTPYMR